MKTWKRMFALLMALVMAVSLCACGGQTAEDAPKADAPEVAEKEDAPKAEAAGEEEKEEVVLKMVLYAGATANALETLNQKFTEKYPWITVELDLVDVASYAETRNTRVAAKELDLVMTDFVSANAPDYAIGVNPTWCVQYVNDGVVMDLTGQEFLNNFNSTFVEDYCTYDGKVYGVPQGLHATNLIIYSKAIFDQYGLSEPKTWDEFIAICETLKSNGVEPLSAGFKDGWPANMMWGGVASATEDMEALCEGLWTGTRKWNDAETMKIWERIDQLSDYFESGVTAVDLNTLPSRLVGGKVAMINGATWDEASIAAMDPNFEYGVFPIPGTSDAKLFGKCDGSISICASTKHPEEALLWLEFYSQQDIYAEFINTAAMFPAMDVEVTSPMLSSLMPYFDTFEPHLEAVLTLFKPAGVGIYADFGAISNLTKFEGDIADIKALADLAQADWDDAVSKLQ